MIPHHTIFIIHQIDNSVKRPRPFTTIMTILVLIRSLMQSLPHQLDFWWKHFRKHLELGLLISLLEFVTLMSFHYYFREFFIYEMTIIIFEIHLDIFFVGWIFMGLSFLTMTWQILEVNRQLSLLYPSLPYLRAFQWSTVWPFT